MAEKRGTLAVLTGGGDCPGLNAVIRAVVKTAVTHGYEDLWHSQRLPWAYPG